MAKYEAEKKQEKPSNEEAENALAWAMRNGILRGDENGNLMPQATLTREQMAIILERYANR